MCFIAIDGSKQIESKESEFEYVSLKMKEQQQQTEVTKEITSHQSNATQTILRAKPNQNGWLIYEWRTINAKGKIFFYFFFYLFFVLLNVGKKKTKWK